MDYCVTFGWWSYSSDNQSPPLLWSWVFLFKTGQNNRGLEVPENIYLECIEEIGMSQSFQNSIFTFFSLRFLATPPNKLAKNVQSNSFCKAEDDPTISINHLATMKVVGFGFLEL